MQNIDRSRLAQLCQTEELRFTETHPKSYEMFQRARRSLYGGVPMLWMIRWAGSFPVFEGRPKARILRTWMVSIILIFASEIPEQ